jgi:hypothetical protein
MTRRTAAGAPEFKPGPGFPPGPEFPVWGARSPLGAQRELPDYDPAAKWVRLGAVVVLLPLMAFDLMILGLSPMALDHCERGEACWGEIHGAITIAGVALLAAAVTLLVSLCLRSRRGRRAARGWLVAGAALAALTSLAALFTL